MKKLDSEDWVGISQAYRFQTKGRASVKTHEEPSKFKTLKGGWIISSVKERERERERERLEVNSGQIMQNLENLIKNIDFILKKMGNLKD